MHSDSFNTVARVRGISQQKALYRPLAPKTKTIRVRARVPEPRKVRRRLTPIVLVFGAGLMHA